jgi:hypothetical protein
MRTLVLIAVVLLPACVTVYPPDSPAAEEAPPEATGVRLGETARLGPTNITPLVVLEDSRCPALVRCVWAGRVRLRARIGRDAADLTLGQPHTVRGGAVTLVEVQPQRRSNNPVQPGDYRFSFRFAAG